MKTRSSWLINLILAGILSTPSIVAGETLLRTIQCKEKYWDVFLSAMRRYCKEDSTKAGCYDQRFENAFKTCQTNDEFNHKKRFNIQIFRKDRRFLGKASVEEIEMLFESFTNGEWTLTYTGMACNDGE